MAAEAATKPQFADEKMNSAKRSATDQVLGKWLYELEQTEVFQAQIEIEDRLLANARAKLESLDLKDPALTLQYAKTRSEIETLKQLRAARASLIDGRNANTSPSIRR